MTLIQVLKEHSAIFLTLAGLFGLVIGSFLNVVIHRLPTIMRRAWEADCRETLGLLPLDPDAKLETLSHPRSRCAHCGHGIAAYENIPVLSYVLLRGRCSACRAPISLQYPFIEILAGVTAAVAAAHYGVSWQSLAAMGFGFA